MVVQHKGVERTGGTQAGGTGCVNCPSRKAETRIACLKGCCSVLKGHSCSTQDSLSLPKQLFAKFGFQIKFCCTETTYNVRLYIHQ